MEMVMQKTLLRRKRLMCANVNIEEIDAVLPLNKDDN
jgi:hypothetical protein